MAETYTLLEAQDLVYKFEATLRNIGIEIAKNSELERLCLNIIDVVEKHLNPTLRDPKADIRPYAREFVGMKDLMSKIVNAAGMNNFSELLPHLKKLNEANPLQNVRTSVLNQENDKMFELFMATLCLGLSPKSISLDHPERSKGDNPDILVELGGKIWGLGCKAPHSFQSQSIFKNIESAVEQIEDSSAETGIPVITLKNIFDHDKCWPLLNEKEYRNGEKPYFGAFLDLTYPRSRIRAYP